MGLFDSKKVREEKRAYQALLAIKDTSHALIGLPKTEKEFLSSNYKERYINIHKYALEIMKDNTITQTFGLSNLGKCYDFIDRYYNAYALAVERKRTSDDFMTYLRNAINPELVIAEAKKQEEISRQQFAKKSIEADRGIDYIEAQIQQLNNLPGAARAYDAASQGARDTFLRIHEQAFKTKFPEYTGINALIIYHNLGIMDQEKKQKIAEIIERGKIHDTEFVLEDITLPYLIEKAVAGILSSEEQKVYATKATLDQETINKKIYAALSVITDMYYNKSATEVHKAFENSWLQIEQQSTRPRR